MMGGDEKERRGGVRGAFAGLLGLYLVRKARNVIRALFQYRSRPIPPTKADHVRALVAQMTEKPGENEWETPPHDPEGIPWRKVAVIATIALSFYTIGTIIAWLQLRGLQAGRESSIPFRIGEPRINMLIQPLFDLETASYEQHRHERLRLSSYGWSDRDAGMIHVPVERAMEELLAEEEERSRGQGSPP